MKNFIDGIVRASFEQWIGFIIIIFVSMLGALIIIAIAMPKHIDCYYMVASSEGTYPTYRIYAQVNWEFDSKVFISSDYHETLEVIATMNQCGQ